MGSFKLKLVAYFSLIALLPFAAAFSGLEAVTDKNETRRVDGTLETSVRDATAFGSSRGASGRSDRSRSPRSFARSPWSDGVALSAA